jgi:hypothetical protein
MIGDTRSPEGLRDPLRHEKVLSVRPKVPSWVQVGCTLATEKEASAQARIVLGSPGMDH